MPSHIPGKLKLKGVSEGKKKRKKRDRDDKTVTQTDTQTHETIVKHTDINADEFLTETQRKHQAKKMKLEAERMKDVVTQTYRDRVESFNYKLATMTEHNDIPRVSAAGNG
eukprot:CAMPEP_0185036106 /NCGR_PEP_ID=MMETSP1103-20130426/28569_1 /TAXON_ID=36769 /ORGANISM="Paraphysomonas bandaiensis, Strain Caron Lab Isolate" /LENGTH=110 /DNA_ID=CAMNT_0027573499 /DNA_START=18 /DNA_END=350 /DNA_ORIENTATION=+